ncbi:hypothetical protein [Frankia sp. Cppng1_Ct_nod]|uniref:hypothetical protein n=1 Tax=Frankia sp. Cppng1_Ct_nod TaxID=2897162 RepID=UPI001A9502C9|nr:hypothetical protein [Frankia sp. Cppng1_Ct_nod]
MPEAGSTPEVKPARKVANRRKSVRAAPTEPTVEVSAVGPAAAVAETLAPDTETSAAVAETPKAVTEVSSIGADVPEVGVDVPVVAADVPTVTVETPPAVRTPEVAQAPTVAARETPEVTEGTLETAGVPEPSVVTDDVLDGASGEGEDGAAVEDGETAENGQVRAPARPTPSVARRRWWRRLRVRPGG